MDGLFSAVDLDAGGARVGYRLDRLEMYNWGTFDKHVWTFHPGMDNTLLTGDVGSGKSTIVDAITTLLLPANRISYNKAAGAETRERNLRSYVLGYHKSERSEATGTSKPVGLRRADAYSVLLATFVNEGMSDTVTIAQVFWFNASNQGQPDRFYVVTDDRLSIAEDCADFGGQIANLKRRLRKSGALVYDHFPEYGREFRRRLGIPSEQAMELFHQTVSMKSVGDLNEFVRDHMLEPFDMASRIKDLVQHFGDLNAAHEAVLKARAQLDLLAPLLADCDEYDRLSSEITSLSAQRMATRYFCAERKAGLLDTRVGELTRREVDLAGQERSLGTHITALRNELTRLEVERAGHGGNRIAEIGREIEAETSVKEQREHRHRQFSTWLADAQLDPVTSAAEFAQRRTEIDEATVTVNDRRTQLQNALTDAEVELRELDREVKEVNDELLSLRGRPNNIPRKSLDLRDRLCDVLGMDTEQLPFAGELITVRGDGREWEGAAERVLHSFGLSVLVADEHYARVADWINENHLGMRLVYYRVPAKIGQSQVEPAGPRPLYEMLDIKESPFEPWLRRELTRRANYACVDSMHEFRRAASAVTRQGQIKASGGRHEKDDRTRIGDRRSYVLGWTNESKIDALIDQAAALQHKVDAAKKARDDTVSELTAVNARVTALSKLGDVTDYDDIDWGRSVTRIDELEDERKQLESSSEELRSITKRIEDVTGQIGEAEERKRKVTGELGGIRTQLQSAEREHTIAKAVLDEPAYADTSEHFAALDELAVGQDRVEPADWDQFAEQAVSQINSGIEKRNSQRNGAGQRAVAKMRDFRGRYPLETTEADDSIEAADEYRKLHARLQDDDLPRFERDFKDFLNTNTIRDIANFQSQLNKQLELIKERVDTINDSLVAIDYNPGRYIRLEQEPTDNMEVRQFRSDLRACTASSLGEEQSEQYSEDKFLQVKAIIERFSGREGQTDADRHWTRRVTDVRNWSVFSATERWGEDNTEHEHYTDSGGKSGGQKEKLAYTILAASLAYQFKLEWGSTRSKNFQFVVIDEAFGRGSDNSTRFALRLFQKLGLQLLVITPLQKIHVIEPYVLSVGFVDNRSGKYSRLQTLTIEEYRERMAAASVAAASVAAVTAGDGR